MSRRVAYFTDLQIYWICLTCIESESRTHLDKFADLDLLRVKPAVPLYVAETTKKTSVSLDWEQMVEVYSHKKLTFAKDRLVALAGVARLFHAHSEDALGMYCAGLWEHHLTWGLTWFTDCDHYKHPVARRSCCENPAPTWSWASIECPVTWYNDILGQPLILLDTIEKDIQPVSDPFGSPRNARIRIAAPMIIYDYKVRRGESPFPGGSPLPGYGLKLYFDGASCALCGTRPGSTLCYFIGLLCYNSHPHRSEVIALCIESSGRQTGEYRRIGLASFQPDVWEGAKHRSSELFGARSGQQQPVELTEKSRIDWSQWQREEDLFLAERAATESKDVPPDPLPIPDDSHLGLRSDGKYIIDLV